MLLYLYTLYNHDFHHLDHHVTIYIDIHCACGTVWCALWVALLGGGGWLCVANCMWCVCTSVYYQWTLHDIHVTLGTDHRRNCVMLLYIIFCSYNLLCIIIYVKYAVPVVSYYALFFLITKVQNRALHFVVIVMHR